MIFLALFRCAGAAVLKRVCRKGVIEEWAHKTIMEPAVGKPEALDLSMWEKRERESRTLGEDTSLKNQNH